MKAPKKLRVTTEEKLSQMT
jgi:hypothetical protein